MMLSSINNMRMSSSERHLIVCIQAISKHEIPYYPTVKLFIDSQAYQLPLSEMDVGDPKW